MGKIVSVYEHFGLRTFRFTNISFYEHFGLRTFRFTNDLQERIMFVNRSLTVLQTTLHVSVICRYAASFRYFIHRPKRTCILENKPFFFLGYNLWRHLLRLFTEWEPFCQTHLSSMSPEDGNVRDSEVCVPPGIEGDKIR